MSICDFSVMILLKAGREASRRTAGPVFRIVRFSHRRVHAGNGSIAAEPLQDIEARV